MSNPATFSASPNATFSLVSEDGALPCAKPDGAIAAPSGPAAARVSRFRAQDADKAMPTNDTSGPLFSASSPSASLQRSLENRLRARMGVNGSQEYALIWKHWDMPAGLPICALRASARRTSGSGFTGWPTPTTQANAQVAGQYATNGTTLAGAARLLGWRTPTSWDGERGTYDLEKVQARRKLEGKEHAQVTLVQQVYFMGWATPQAQDAKMRISNAEMAMKRQAKPNAQVTLEQQAHLMGWATPRARDAKNNGVSIARAQQGIADSLDLQCKLVSQNGMAPPSPLTARTDRRALPLNPRFSLWLQGYPATWADCAAPVTRLSRK